MLQTNAEVRGSPIWPTVEQANSSSVVFLDTYITRPISECTPELAAKEVSNVQQLVGSNTTVTLGEDGLTLEIHTSLTLPFVIQDNVLKQQSARAASGAGGRGVSCLLTPLPPPPRRL